MSRLSHRRPWKHIWIGVEKRGCLHSPGKLGRPPCSWACRRWSPCSPLADSSWWTTHQYFPQPNLNLLPDRVSKGHGCINAHPIIFASSRPSGKGARGEGGADRAALVPQWERRGEFGVPAWERSGAASPGCPAWGVRRMAWAVGAGWRSGAD